MTFASPFMMQSCAERTQFADAREPQDRNNRQMCAHSPVTARAKAAAATITWHQSKGSVLVLSRRTTFGIGTAGHGVGAGDERFVHYPTDGACAAAALWAAAQAAVDFPGCARR